MSSENIVLLGRGSYGTVYRVSRPALRALKIIPYEQTIPAEAIREIATLRRLEGTHSRERFARLLDFEFSHNSVTLALQYGNRGTLASRLRESDLPSLSRKMLWAAQLLEGVEALHQECILHRDLKPENIVLTAKDDLKLIDFGLSRTFAAGQPLTPHVCTLFYRPPELLLHFVANRACDDRGLVYGTEVDCWSAGCILRELITCRGPEFRPTVLSANPRESSEEQLTAIMRRFGYEFSVCILDQVNTFCTSQSVLLDICTPSVAENALREISRGLLVPNPSSRLTCGKARELLRQVDVLGRLECCWLQASSYNFGLSIVPRKFCTSSIGQTAAPQQEERELTRLLRRIEPDMAHFLDSLLEERASDWHRMLSSGKSSKGAYGEALTQARGKMAHLWPSLREMHIRAVGSAHAWLPRAAKAA